MPKLFHHLEPFWEAFDLLSSSRTFTIGGAGPIPNSEVACFLDEEGIMGRAERRRFKRYVKALDCVYLEAVNKRESK